MKLLNIKEIKREKIKKDVIRQKMIDKLNKESSDAVKNFNKTKMFVKKEIEILNKQLLDHRKLIKEKKEVLIKEVVALEARRRDATLPIKKMRLEAEDVLKKASIFENRINKGKKLLDKQWSELALRIEDVIDKETSLIEKKEDFEKRKKAILQEEKRVKEISINLAKRQTDFSKKVVENNKEFERQELELRALEKTNRVVKESNEKEAQRLKDLNRQIVDKYSALLQAKKHLGIK